MPFPVTRPPGRRRAARAFAAPLVALLSVLLAVSSGLAGCGEPVADPDTAIVEAVAAGLPRLHPVVLGTLPHERTAWTEGLEISGGVLYEGTGLAGRSQLRALDPDTGRLLRAAALPDGRYGEGITVLGTTIWQLTYRDHLALRWERRTLDNSARSASPDQLTMAAQLPYPREGWGLCHTPDRPGGPAIRLVASDGSSRLRLLSPVDLAPVGELSVRALGRLLTGLNELECVAGSVWANVYPTNWLARISLATGTVTAVVDAGELYPPDQRAAAGNGASDVLNGIAAIPGTDQFLLTGKQWPMFYRVRFR
ncbi:MAG TPA: glutaminyl-peptide cyclotransferase [Pseudonocardia sp.]|uniref:glutaminyl-peptide cyclotransferase n=1 Tax=Pseudonocardia sp. TaxID=60912 RepID=UPI002F42885C